MAMAMGTATAQVRHCRDCGTGIASYRFYCDDDRDRRRAITFALQAERLLGPMLERRLAAGHRGAGLRAAKGHLNAAIVELGG